MKKVRKYQKVCQNLCIEYRMLRLGRRVNGENVDTEAGNVQRTPSNRFLHVCLKQSKEKVVTGAQGKRELCGEAVQQEL